MPLDKNFEVALANHARVTADLLGAGRCPLMMQVVVTTSTGPEERTFARLNMSHPVQTSAYTFFLFN